MTDLVSRLLEAITQTERIARAAMGTPDREGAGVWTRECGHLGLEGEELPPSHDLCAVVDGDIHIYDEGGHSPEQAEHIAHHDPEAVLRRCAADRKQLAEHADNGMGSCRVCCMGPMNDPVPLPCNTLLNLAEGYGIQEDQ